MEEIQDNIFQSSLKHENDHNYLVSNRMINIDDEEEKKKLLHDSISSNYEPTKTIHRYYFVKFPATKAEIEKAKELNSKKHAAIEIILDEISSKKALALKENGKLRWISAEYIRANIEYWKRQLDTRYPEGNDSDPELEPELESINLDKRIQKLSYQCNHGNKTTADERRTISELNKLQRRKEQPYKNDKTKRNDNKYLQRRIQEGLKELRIQQRIESTVEQKKAEIGKEIMSLEQKIANINQKRAKENDCIVTAQNHLNDQIVRYNENMKLLSHAKELATKKDLVALEELCCNQVEEFMSLWNTDNQFRANYERSKTEIQNLKVRNLVMEVENWKLERDRLIINERII